MLFLRRTTVESPEGTRLIYCQTCRTGRNATLWRVRLWMTSYGLRVLPLWVVDRYLVCGTCGERFGMDVLRINPGKSAPLFDQQMLRTMIYAALADGLVDAAERKAIGQLYDEFFEMALLEDQLELEISAAKRESASLNTYLGHLAELMTPEQKQTTIELTYRVMHAGGPPKPGHQRQLHNLCHTLQMPPNQFDHMLAELESKAIGSGYRPATRRAAKSRTSDLL